MRVKDGSILVSFRIWLDFELENDKAGKKRKEREKKRRERN